MKSLTKKMMASALMGCCLFAASSSPALDVYLRAVAFDKTLPDGNVVKMWGFAPDTDLSFNDNSPATSPGPQINAASTDTALVIYLKNELTVPVSIVIPNQNGFDRTGGNGDPGRFNDAEGRSRARSFVKETAAGATGTYTWNNLTPGTYLYYSGSHPSLQVQMGLYGAMVKNAATPAANSEQVLVFSELDTNVHYAVAIGNYRDFANSAWVPTDATKPVMDSTIHSVPNYFLINGAPFPQVSLPEAIGPTVMLRLLNASVNSHIPVVYGLQQKAIAEDGRPYPYPKYLTAPELPALKTMDVLLESLPVGTSTYPIYDRALGLANGGMLTALAVTTPAAAPTPISRPVPTRKPVQKPVRTATLDR